MRGDYWPQWRVDMLLELADGTRSSSEIAGILGVTKGVVLGKLDRLRKRGAVFKVLVQTGKSGSPWTYGELQRLARLEIEGASLLTMSFRLGRTRDAIGQKRIIIKRNDPDWPYSAAAIPPPPPVPPAPPLPEWRDYAKPRMPERKRRNCLCCGKPFMSAGPGNRLCDVHRRADGGPDHHAHMPTLRY